MGTVPSIATCRGGGVCACMTCTPAKAWCASAQGPQPMLCPFVLSRQLLLQHKTLQYIIILLRCFRLAVKAA